MSKVFLPFYFDNCKTNYLISNYGDVFSLYTNKCLSPATDRYGYKFVSLSINKKIHQMKIHRLVALTFIPIRFNHQIVVNHKDGIKINNHVDNLEWCTIQENTIHAYKSGLASSEPTRGERNVFVKYSEKNNSFNM